MRALGGPGNDGNAPADSWRRGGDHSAPLIRELVARAARQDGVAAVSGHVLDALDSGSVDYLVIPQDGELVGARIAAVAVAVGGDPAEVVVEPGSRGHGFGSALVSAAVERQGAVWAYGDLPAAAAVATRLGLHRGRVLLQMRRVSPSARSAPSVPSVETGAAQLPTGVRIRRFVPGQDEAAFLAVNARAFAWHPEQGRLDLAGLQAEMAQDWFDPDGFFLAVSTGANGEAERLLGFHWTKVHSADPNPGDIRPDSPDRGEPNPGDPDRDDPDRGEPNPGDMNPVDPNLRSAGARPGPIGEVYVLAVDPDSGIRGLGTPLTAIGLDYLRGRGLDTVMLYVEADNDRAVRLYERLGFSTFLANVVYLRSDPAEQ